MKKYILLIVALNTLLTYSQITLPINFEDGVVTTDDFIDFNGGTGSVIDNPYVDELNPSDLVAKIIHRA